MLPEVQTYLDELNALRADVLQTLEGPDANALNWRPLPTDTNSLFVLATHSLGSERGWFGSVIGNKPGTRDRAGEFRAQGNDIAALRTAYRENERLTREVLAPLTAQDLDAVRQHHEHGTVTVRWIILHILKHYSEHLGQMRLTRQLWEYQKKSQ
jgi:uncharacterized damage-inducible protein DinB